MNLLAIDTSTDTASVAILLGEEVLHKEQGNQKTQAQFLLPMIDTLLLDAGILVSQLDGIIFGCGPGSFTGLRIACSVAKGLAYAHDLGLIPVSSLASIAWSARQGNPESNLPVLAVLDARMHEMYWAYYANNFSPDEHVSAVTDIVLPNDQPILLAGVGIEEHWSSFSEKIKAQISAQIAVHPNAVAMIQLARALEIPAIPVDKAQPVYVRNKVTYEQAKKS
jgi:tRNA threonylcarbamoyladenosine biosynthesis protein TsaB